ncbi:type VII secretion integral membrane protein EccD [Mycobacteroides abscessus]|uniref:type VII secretion integral membrane protein EccD n=1 Tax=Mycobacteroides abscessus TaxID=36809 RepID=UPI000C25C5B5|nr:type VII secretion integral membrane protein EccD [Mycobacteroides abscessus]MBN7374143.1 type VII secretion integral membrane protein EccD [Mycobacteroides abscessus subsp. abscessus]RIR16442.1 type VII secretion integral membrane protein EccD [Mycobacteroides abscessus]
MSTPTDETTSEQTLATSRTRVAVFVGDGNKNGPHLDGEPDGTELDWALPSTRPLIAAVEDLMEGIGRELHRLRLPALDPKTTYVLCDADGRPLDVQKTLDQCGVLDGDLLWLLPAESTEKHAKVTERVSTAIARSAAEQFRTVDPQITQKLSGLLVAGLVGWILLILTKLWWDSGSIAPAAAAAALAVALLTGSWVASSSPKELRRKAFGPLVWSGVGAFCAAAALAIPGAPSGWNLAAAAGTLVLSVYLLALITGRYPAAVALCITLGLAGFAAAVLRAGLHVPPERIAAASLSIVVMLVTYAASIGGVVSGVPTPSFPSYRSRGVFEQAPNRPRKSVSPVATGEIITGDQVAKWARRGNLTMTGIALASSLLLIAGCRWVVIPGQPWSWRNLVFAVGICLIVLLWSQSMVDRVQSLSLAGASFVGIAIVIGRYAAASPSSVPTTLLSAALVALLAVGVLLAGLWLPDASLKPPIRRAIMGLHLLLIAVLTIPWMLWIWETYAFLRHARH